MSTKLTKEEFIKLIEEYQEKHDFIDKACNIFPGFFENEIVEYANIMFDRLMSVYFTDEGVDWIAWWLFERLNVDEPQAWDENHKVIPTSTIEDLWEIVKDEFRIDLEN